MFTTAHLHPMVVHFPVALIITGMLFEFLGLIYKNQSWLKQAGTWLLFFGTLGSIAAYLTGEYFTNEMKGHAGELEETHELMGKITMFILILTSLLRIWQLFSVKVRSRINWLVLVLYFIAVIFIGITGFLGGSLVYNYLIPGKI